MNKKIKGLQESSDAFLNCIPTPNFNYIIQKDNGLLKLHKENKFEEGFNPDRDLPRIYDPETGTFPNFPVMK